MYSKAKLRSACTAIYSHTSFSWYESLFGFVGYDRSSIFSWLDFL